MTEREQEHGDRSGLTPSKRVTGKLRTIPEPNLQTAGGQKPKRAKSILRRSRSQRR